MNSNRKSWGVLLAATMLGTAAVSAQDKPTNAPMSGAASTNAGSAVKANDLFPDEVIVKGKGFEIKRSQLDEAVSGVRATATARGRELTPADLPLIERSALDHLLQIELLKGQATAADKAKATTNADQKIDAIKKRVPSEEALNRQLKLMNMTMDSLRARLIEEASAEQVLRDKINVTDEQVRKFYDDNPSQFEEPEKVRASHILISTLNQQTGAPLSDEDKKAKKKTAEEVLKKARAGDDFAKLAAQYSDDPGSKDKGGEYIFARGQMVKEFEAAAFSMQTNQISDIVTTQFGYHIIKLSEKIPAKKQDFAKVAPDLRNYLEGREMEKILPETYAALKKTANVQIMDPDLKTLMDALPLMPKAPTNGIPNSPPTQ